MNKLLSFLTLLSAMICYSQSLPSIKTVYKLSNGTLGKENFTFSMSNGTMYKTDLDLGYQTKYNFLEISNSGYNGSLFAVTYSPNIRAHALEFVKNPGVKVYKIFYDQKGGSVLAIAEAEESGTAYYYTDLGYQMSQK